MLEPQKLELRNIAEIVAPFVIANDIPKEIVGLQMFMNIKEEKFHSLLVGATGSAKTDFCLFAKANHPSAVKVGKDTTSAGLRGTMSKFGLIGGVLRSPGGKIIAFDEIDKTGKDTRNTLLEVMQERTCTVTGQHGHTSYDSYVNIIATANPRGGTWMGEPSLSQVPFDKILLSRFHIFIPFFDLPIEQYALLGASFHRRTTEDMGAAVREKIHECMDIQHVDITQKQYTEVASKVGHMKETNDLFGDYITPRYIEGAVSLIKAHARFRNRDHILPLDITYVFDLYDRNIRNWMY